MEKEHYIKTDQEIREKQRKYVHVPQYDKDGTRKGKSKSALVKR
jgi:hypothetical protein